MFINPFYEKYNEKIKRYELRNRYEDIADLIDRAYSYPTVDNTKNNNTESIVGTIAGIIMLVSFFFVGLYFIFKYF